MIHSEQTGAVVILKDLLRGLPAESPPGDLGACAGGDLLDLRRSDARLDGEVETGHRAEQKGDPRLVVLGAHLSRGGGPGERGAQRGAQILAVGLEAQDDDRLRGSAPAHHPADPAAPRVVGKEPARERRQECIDGVEPGGTVAQRARSSRSSCS